MDSEGPSSSSETILVPKPPPLFAEVSLSEGSSTESPRSTPPGSDEEATGNMDGACEAAVHAMDELRSEEGWMHVDA